MTTTKSCSEQTSTPTPGPDSNEKQNDFNDTPSSGSQPGGEGIQQRNPFPEFNFDTSKLEQLLNSGSDERHGENSEGISLKKLFSLDMGYYWIWFKDVLKNTWSLIWINSSRFRIMGMKAISREVLRPIMEIIYFPHSVYETFRTRAFLHPFQGLQQFFSDFNIHKEIKRNIAYSIKYARSVYCMKWSRPGKVYVTGVALLSFYTLYHYKIRAWNQHDPRKEIDCLHKTVIITGSSAGIGYRLAFEFAKRGAFVILTSPDMVKARKARLDLSRTLIQYVDVKRRSVINQAQVRYYDQLEIPPTLDIDFLLHNIVELDLNLASTASIYSFTRKVQGMSPQGIDILINNASINAPPEEMVVTDEGKEVHFAVNYFGHFILTNLLLGQLAKRKGSRIINVTCKYAAQQGAINLKQFIEPYLLEDGLPYLPAFNSYEDSKLAMYLFSRQLAKELQLSCINNVTTYSVCPGKTTTFIRRHMRDPNLFTRYWNHFTQAFYKKDHHAVQPILHCALSCKVNHESGFFYENNRRSSLKIRHTYENQIAKELWTTSMTLMGVGHNSMLKLTEQMHIRSNENIYQLGSGLFLHRRDVMTHLLLMEEQHAFKNRHKKFVNEMGDARDDFTYFWHGFHLAGGNRSTLLERWVLYNCHPGFRELQKEYDIRFECSGSSHYYPQANGKMASLQYMASMPQPLTQDDIEELEDLYESDSEPDGEFEHKDRYHKAYIPMDEYIK